MMVSILFLFSSLLFSSLLFSSLLFSLLLILSGEVRKIARDGLCTRVGSRSDVYRRGVAAASMTLLCGMKCKPLGKKTQKFIESDCLPEKKN